MAFVFTKLTNSTVLARSLINSRFWLGEQKTLAVGAAQDVYVTTPIGQAKRLSASLDFNQQNKAPIHKGQILGELHVKLGKQLLFTTPVLALDDNPRCHLLSCLKDYLALSIHHWLPKE